MMRKKIIVVASLIMITAGITGVIIFRHMYNTNPVVARKVGSSLPVRIVSAETKPLTEVIGARGEMQAISILTITSKLDRRVGKVFVEAGDTIKKGDTLVKFDDVLLNAALASAEDEIKKVQFDLDNATLFYERMVRLYKKGIMARIDVENAEGKVKNEKLILMKAKENLLDIKSALNDSTVKSPVNGVILESFINSGETPRIDQPMFRIGASDSMFMVAYVDERKLKSIRISQDAEVVFDAYSNNVYSGSILKIGPQIDNKTATFPVFISLKDVDVLLKHGLTGAVRVKNTNAALTVPSISIINPVGDSASLFVVDDKNIAHLRPVKIGAMAEGLTEIVGGIEGGERVVTIGQLYLHDKDMVHIGDELNEIGKEYAQKKDLDPRY